MAAHHETKSGSTIAIVGAGLAGLAAARRLADAGRAVTLFEKARGVGGRMSTRRAEPWAFDHGAQYFTVRGEAFRVAVEGWAREGVVRAWSGHVVDLEHGAQTPRRTQPTRYVATPGMSALCKHLAQGLTVHTQTRIARLARGGHAWMLVDTAGSMHGPFDAVLVTAPPEQAAALLGVAPDFQRVAASVRMDPGWAVMAAFPTSLALPFDAAFVHDGPLAWVCCNSKKPERPRGGGEAWMLHASSAWSQDHVEATAEEVIAALLEAWGVAARVTLPATTHVAAHRWLYARTYEPAGRACLWDAELGLGVCGDWLLGERVESAYESGVAVARALLAR